VCCRLHLTHHWYYWCQVVLLRILGGLKDGKQMESGEELSPVMATDDGLENLDI
jgi:hypothetical protein